jgi:hypothetical protein
MVWLGWLMVFNPTIFQLYRGGQFYWWRKPECPEKTTDLSKTLSHNVVSCTHCHEQGSHSQLQWWKALIAQVVVNNPTTIRSQTRRSRMYNIVTATIITLDCDTMQYSQICGTCGFTNIKFVAMQLSDDLLRIKKRDCTGSNIIRLQQDDKGFSLHQFYWNQA